MPLSATWMDLEKIIVSEVRQRKINIVVYIYMQNLKTVIQIKLFIKEAATDLENKLTVTTGERVGGKLGGWD